MEDINQYRRDKEERSRSRGKTRDIEKEKGERRERIERDKLVRWRGDSREMRIMRDFKDTRDRRESRESSRYISQNSS